MHGVEGMHEGLVSLVERVNPRPVACRGACDRKAAHVRLRAVDDRTRKQTATREVVRPDAVTLEVSRRVMLDQVERAPVRSKGVERELAVERDLRPGLECPRGDYRKTADRPQQPGTSRR